jgi:hypothetical protein
MPGMHISESFPRTTHVPDAGPPHAVSGDMRHAALSNGSPNISATAHSYGAAVSGHRIGHIDPRSTDATAGLSRRTDRIDETQPRVKDERASQPANEPVLRLRGGGGVHGKSSRDDQDRAQLMPKGESSSYRAHHGGASGSAAERVAAMTKRSELQSRLDRAKAELAEAKQKYQSAVADLDAMRAHLLRLEDERARFAGDPAHRDEIQRQWRAANDDYHAKTFAAWPYRTAVERYEKECRRLENKLSKLPRG